MNLKISEEMMPHVKEIMAGEYFVVLPEPPKLVLDIGANEGGFTAWAREVWPDCSIDAYEPMPFNCDVFQENHGHDAKVRLHRVAVANQHPVTMFMQGVNTGECSRFAVNPCAPSMQVNGMPPIALPAADFVKIDTEGCELEIVQGLDLYKTSALALEYHREEDILPIIAEVNKKGLSLWHYRRYVVNRGVLKFLRL